MIYDPEFANTCLYILMRMDMESLNAGKGMAQAAHAANQFVHEFGSSQTPGYDDWQMGGGDGSARRMGDDASLLINRTTCGFGTTIILAVDDEVTLRYYLENALSLGHPAGIVLDETYPVTDGEVTHLVPVHTCGYVFVKNRNQNGGVLLEGLALHP